LFFKFSFENSFHVFELERADGRSLKAVGACGEDRVEGRVVVRGLIDVLKVSNKNQILTQSSEMKKNNLNYKSL
jgi:hypothetical protein